MALLGLCADGASLCSERWLLMPAITAMSLGHDVAAVRRIVLGKELRVKGLVGFSSIRRDAEERGESAQDRWYEEAQGSKASEVNGTHADFPRIWSTKCLYPSTSQQLGV